MREMGIEREQSSTSEVEGEEKQIVILALCDEALPWRKLCGTQLYYTGRAKFHWVDLKHNMLTLSCFPSIVMTMLSSALVSSLNKFIYLVGGVHSPDHRFSDESASSNHKFYSGGSYFDMSDEAPVWCPAPVFVEDTDYPNYVSFLGKIYNFGSVRLAPQVLDCGGALGQCKSIRSLTIPQSLSGCSVSVPVVPDPSNKRILMRLYGGPLSSPSLYAFTPDPVGDAFGTWECLSSDFQLWAYSAAVVNGVIYFHGHKVASLCAFHITKKIWLKVWWDSCFKGNIDMSVETFSFDAMLHLGHNILCFAGWMPLHIYPEPDVSAIEVMFYKFRVVVTGETVTVKVCDSYSYELPEYTEVLHFLSI